MISINIIIIGVAAISVAYLFLLNTKSRLNFAFHTFLKNCNSDIFTPTDVYLLGLSSKNIRFAELLRKWAMRLFVGKCVGRPLFTSEKIAFDYICAAFDKKQKMFLPNENFKDAILFLEKQEPIWQEEHNNFLKFCITINVNNQTEDNEEEDIDDLLDTSKRYYH